jgi:hypothetical protein
MQTPALDEQMQALAALLEQTGCGHIIDEKKRLTTVKTVCKRAGQG